MYVYIFSSFCLCLFCFICFCCCCFFFAINGREGGGRRQRAGVRKDEVTVQFSEDCFVYKNTYTHTHAHAHVKLLN